MKKLLKNKFHEKEKLVSRLALILLILVFIPKIAFAEAGLSTSWGEVILRNVSIGQTYKTTQLLNLPLRVTNTGDMEIEVQVEIIAPTEGNLKEGYEVIPSTSWIQLGQDYFTIGPKESAVTDVVISIPDEVKYLGKKYQFHIYSHSVSGTGFMGLGLMSRVLLEVAPIRSDISAEEIRELKANLNFSVNPATIYADSVKLGRNYNLEKLTGKAFKLINPNDELYSYKVTSISPKQLVISPPKDYEVCPDASFLKIDKPEIKVSANGIEKIKMYLNIPYKEEYKHKKYMFVVYTDVLNQNIPVGKYNLLYVSTEE